MNLGGTSEGYIKITEGSQLKSYACCLGTFYRKKNPQNTLLYCHLSGKERNLTYISGSYIQ